MLLYPKLDRCYRLGRYLFEEIMAEHAIWAGQDRIMCALRADGITTQGELGRRLYMNHRTLHRSLKYLGSLNYIKLSESPTDMRIKAIRLTNLGKFAVGAIEHTYGIVSKQMCVGLSGVELLEFNRLLDVAVMREPELRARKLDLREVLDRGYF